MTPAILQLMIQILLLKVQILQNQLNAMQTAYVAPYIPPVYANPVYVPPSYTNPTYVPPAISPAPQDQNLGVVATSTPKAKAPVPPYALYVSAHLGDASTNFHADFSSDLGSNTPNFYGGKWPDEVMLTSAILTIGSTTYPMNINQNHADLTLDNNLISGGNYTIYIETTDFYLSNIGSW